MTSNVSVAMDPSVPPSVGVRNRRVNRPNSRMMLTMAGVCGENTAMEGKVALFAFNGDPMCFVHVLLNALDLHATGLETAVIIEGSATGLIGGLAAADHPHHELYRKMKDEGLIDCVCQACAHKMGSLEEARDQGLPLCNDMSGHPSMSRYMEQGYTIVTF